MLSKHNAGSGQDDLKSELFEVLCFKEDQFIIDLHNKNQLMYYCTGIVQKFVYQTGGRFHRRYRGQVYEFVEDILSTPDESQKKEMEKYLVEMETAIDNDLHWVEKTIVNLYKEHGSVAKVSEATKVGRHKINEMQVSRILSKSKEKLKSKLCGKLMGNYLVIQNEMVLDVPDEVTPETINDIMDEVLDYMKQRLEGRVIPSKIKTNGYIKSISPLRVKTII
jgi:hypothetical protein